MLRKLTACDYKRLFSFCIRNRVERILSPLQLLQYLKEQQQLVFQGEQIPQNPIRKYYDKLLLQKKQGVEQEQEQQDDKEEWVLL